MANMPEDGPQAGTMFAGRYKIKGFLGEGDRKWTYLADDTLFRRRVALAIIKPEAAGSDPAGTWREAEALAKAGTNDNVVTLHDAGTTIEGIDYLVFDYLPGGTLREYISKRAERGKPLSAEEVMLLGRRLARALAHVHGLGLVHRDVAPGNVWLDERQMAHLGDFDSAISVDSDCSQAGLPPTTEAYAAPEQLKGDPLDHRSDLYSLGAVLYEALTGELPERKPRAEIAMRLTSARPGLPRSLRETVCSLLAESPSERPTSAEEVVEAFKPSRVHSAVTQGLGPWADTLPFPLASILWHYEGEPDQSLKVDYLLKFFEALGQFTATVLLSAYWTDRELWAANHSACVGGHTQLRLQRATFGTWAQLTERLAFTLRTLDTDGDVNRLRQLFCARDLELPHALTAIELGEILRHGCDRRNNWTGHGGVADQHVYRERLDDLVDLLDRTKGVLGWSFEPWTLLKPGPMIRMGRIFDLTATILKGPNSAFRRQQFQLTEALNSGRLYLLEDGNSRALELVPFVRVLSGTTGQEACYFYNRLEGTDVRWVSYHYHRDPELMLPDDGLSDLLAELTELDEVTES